MSLTGSAVQGEPFLVSQFREFFREVLRLKKQVLTGSWTPVPAETSPDADAVVVRANPVWQRLLTLLERQALVAGRQSGEYGTTLYSEAQYVMATLADEIFIHLAWEGGHGWSMNLLESKLFHTHNGGDLFYQKLDRLLKDRDPVYKDLAMVYLLALSAGFRGRFWGQEASPQLEDYRQQLFTFIYGHASNLEHESKHIFAQAYAHTLDEGTTSRLTDTRLWIVMLVVVILIVFVMSHGVWISLTSELHRLSQMILNPQ